MSAAKHSVRGTAGVVLMHLGGLVLVLGVLAAILAIDRSGDRHRHAQLLVSQIELRLSEAQSLPRGADPEEANLPPERVRAALTVAARGMEADLRRLGEIEPRTRRLLPLERKNVAILQRQLVAVAAGDDIRAQDTAGEAVAVSDELRSELDADGRRFSKAADNSNGYTLAGTATVLFALYAAFALTAAMLGRAQRQRVAQSEQLRQSQKLEAVGQLAGGIAHDFNNLLLAIRGFAELAQSSLDPTTPAHEDVGEVIVASNRAATLTRQLLAFSRDQVLLPVVLDPNTAVLEVVSLLERLLGEDIQVEVDLATGLPRVEVDPGQLDQVIVNLALNARDVMPGGGRLLITTSSADQEVLVSVSDTGCGIEQPVLDRMFEPFFTTKEVGAGTGLGLATVWAIVTKSGGHVEVETQLGHGTTFHIHLPATEKPVTALSSPAENLERDATTGTVLVVDDNDAVRQFVVRSLERAGYLVLQARGGNEALELVTTDVDLLVTDLTMPGLSGEDLASRLEHLPVLFISGHPKDLPPSDRQTAFIQKPFSTADLTSAVDQLLTQGPLPKLYAA